MKYLDYKDIYLVPKYSTLQSRSNANPSVDFLGRTFSLPVVPANMKDVIDERIAIELLNKNNFYIMHRWFSFPDDTEGNCKATEQFVKKMNGFGKLTSISVGTGPEWVCFIEECKRKNLILDFVTVDVAHGHHSNVKDVIESVRRWHKDTKLIVGNVATAEGCDYLIRLGAQAVKIGIGGGSICTTKNKTGFHMPMFSCILNCYPTCNKYKIPIIADGGVKEIGDITKALTAGATMVMTGRLFAECIDSPAETIEGFKQYRGSTSFELKRVNTHIEGKKIDLCHVVSYNERLEEISQALKSAISYAGGEDLKAFNEVEYITV